MANGPAIPLVSNRQRYRVKGAGNATGRSGSAEVTARALVGKDGRTVFEMSTGGLDAGMVPRGAFTKAQVKLLDPGNSSRVVATANYVGLAAGYFTATYAGLGAGFPLEVQANIKGADGNRTDVVTVRDRVKRRPDLAVTLGDPGSALVRAPADIAASVRELNGDVGAVADCVLIVDGVAVDRAAGIWVDAGDAVSCAFVHVFATVGSHGVTVRVEGVGHRAYHDAVRVRYPLRRIPAAELSGIVLDRRPPDSDRVTRRPNSADGVVRLCRSGLCLPPVLPVSHERRDGVRRRRGGSPVRVGV
jgi:hypothetical protein